MLIGEISDTHGLNRAEALKIFKGADLIFHGGDIGSVEVLKALEGITRSSWFGGIAIRMTEAGRFPSAVALKLRAPVFDYS